MRLPGFTAEKTVYESETRYSREGSYQGIGQLVQPASVNWGCYAACASFCDYTGMAAACRRECRRRCTRAEPQ